MSAAQWDGQYAAGAWDRLDSIDEVAHYMVLLGYLDYGVRHPKVLDIGCGHGRFLQLLARFGFAEYLGVDISGEAVERARSLSIPKTRFEVADVNRWRTTERFDVIVLNEFLYYADDPRTMFARSLGWLAPEGIVVVSMFRGPGARRIWSHLENGKVELLASSTVTDATGRGWDVKALRLLSLHGSS